MFFNILIWTFKLHNKIFLIGGCRHIVEVCLCMIHGLNFFFPTNDMSVRVWTRISERYLEKVEKSLLTCSAGPLQPNCLRCGGFRRKRRSANRSNSICAFPARGGGRSSVAVAVRDDLSARPEQIETRDRAAWRRRLVRGHWKNNRSGPREEGRRRETEGGSETSGLVCARNQSRWGRTRAGEDKPARRHRFARALICGVPDGFSARFHQIGPGSVDSNVLVLYFGVSQAAAERDISETAVGDPLERRRFWGWDL